MSRYPELTEQMFQEMMSTDEGIHEGATAVPYCDRNSRLIGHYVNWPSYKNKHEISREQINRAKERFQERKEEEMVKAQRLGVLTFHAMGCDYEPKIDGGIGNHRIRARFCDKKGNEWFIEIHPNHDENCEPTEKGFWGEVYDKTYEMNAESDYIRKRKELEEKYGVWWKVPKADRPSSYFVKYERINPGVDFTASGVLDWLNSRYQTDYKEFYLERYFLRPDETLSKC